MLLTKYPALFLILIARSCLAGIRIKTSNPNDSSYYVEAAMNILTSCYSKRIPAIGVVGELPETLLTTLWSQQAVPVVSFSGSTATVEYNGVVRVHMYRLQMFVVAASSHQQLVRNMKKLKNSIWWNHVASFIILYWSPRTNEDCRKFVNFLFIPFQFGVLNAKVICLHSKLGRLILTYNPYRNEAPDSWQLVGAKTGLRNHRFYIFVRKYENGDKICENLDFDKTKNLGGYEIRLLLMILRNERHLLREEISLDYREENNYRLEIILHALNATTKMVRRLFVYNLTDPEQYEELNGGIADMCINPVDTFHMDHPMTYPHSRNRLFIMTQFRGHKSQLEKVLFVIDRNSRIGLCLVLLITLIFFKFVVRQNLAQAFFNVLRIICNTGFTNIPANVAPRFYLASLLLFAVTMQGIYQGQLASLLTTHVPYPDVNTMKELANSGRTVYGFGAYAPLFDDTIFEGRFVGLEEPDCAQYVIDNSSTACIDHEDELIKQAMKLKLHLSREYITTIDHSWIVRENWPLKERFDMLIMTLQEADINEPFLNKIGEKTFEDFIFDEDVQANTKIKVMTLRDLAFSFVILGIGLTCAIITFIVEIMISRFRSRVLTVRVQLLN